MTPIIRIRNATKIFGRRIEDARALMASGISRADVIAKTGATPALFDVSLNIDGGKTIAILGLSGSGKSTLLRLLNRLIDPTAGAVEIAGTALDTADRKTLRDLRRTRISMVFQQFGLLPHRTVRENIALGLELQGKDKAQRRAAAERWIAAVGLEGFDDALPQALSGGMRQRVGLARALATGADILLMDEPFSALDPLTRVEMQDLLIRLQADMHKTIVFVTHDVTEAFRLGDRIALLGDARLVQEGAPIQFLEAPANDYVRRFFRDLDILRGITLGQIARPCAGRDLSAPRLPPDAPLAAAFANLEAAGGAILVGNENDEPLGLVTLQDIQSLIRSVN